MSRKNTSVADAGVGLDGASHSLQLGLRAITTSFNLGAIVAIIGLSPAFLMATNSAERTLWIGRQLARFGVNIFQLYDATAVIDGRAVQLGAWVSDRSNWERAASMIDWTSSVLWSLSIPALLIAIVVGYVIHACASFLGHHYKTDQVLQGVGELITDVDVFNEQSRRLRRGVDVKPTALGKALTNLLA